MHRLTNLHFQLSAGTYVIGGVDEIQLVLDDQIVKIQSMHASPFVKAFKDRIIDWETVLQTLQVCVSCLVICVRVCASWLALSTELGLSDLFEFAPCRTCWTTGCSAKPPGCTWSPFSALMTL